MASRLLLFLCVSGVVAGGLLALVGGTNLAIVFPAATLAIAAATVAGVLVLWERVPTLPSEERTRFEAEMIPLRESFRSGKLGRTNVIATLGLLQLQMTGTAPPPIDEAEEARLLGLSAERFRAWANGEMARLEART
ncbi:MAG TPA: hypothetical protein VJS68_04250 [Thermoplasmata archaeon]|nr:hypothetical protein [Thermoplasmata archaeon]